MKTLDQVITEIEGMEFIGTLADALHYLKEYRSDNLQYDADRREWYGTWQEKLKKLEESRQRFIDKLKELEIGTLNNPITWDELRTMEGKPVFVEADDGKYKRWFIIGNFFSWFEKEDFDAHVNLYRSGGAMEMSKETYGSYWQAYRKERE